MNDILQQLPILESIIVLILLMFGLTRFLYKQYASPGFGIISRWIRWIAISLVTAFFIQDFEWTYRPLWVIASTTFLVWALVETIYTWIYINALSQSDLPLFPRFKQNTSGEEWPVQNRMISIRDWLRSKKYKKVESVAYDVGNGISLRSSIFQSADDQIRIQVYFIPQNKGAIGHCLSLSSELEDGRRIITDNLYLPFGGFYPENWEVSRHPLMRNLGSMIKRHKKRLTNADSPVATLGDSPLLDLNNQQILLERVNLEEGFLVPYNMQEEQGRITWEGRYRFWKEVWLLNYFGMPSR